MPGTGRGGHHNAGTGRGSKPGGHLKSKVGGQMKNLGSGTGHIPTKKDQNKQSSMFTPANKSKRSANVISPLDGVLPKTRGMVDRDSNISSLNQLLEPIDLNCDHIGSLTDKMLKSALGDNTCDQPAASQNKSSLGDQNTGVQASPAMNMTGGSHQSVTADTVLTVDILRQELDRQHARILGAVDKHTSFLLQEQLLPRDKLTIEMASKINVHGAALMELTTMFGELNSNKGGVHLKTRLDRIERQLVDYSFLLEGLDRNDDYPLELLVVNMIRDFFGFNIEARDIDLAVRFGSTDKKPRTVLVTLVCRWMKRSLISSKKVLHETNYKIRDFLPEEVLDVLYAANAEKLVENLNSCWPGRGVCT